MGEILIVGRNNLLGTQIVAGLLELTRQPMTWMLEDMDSVISEELISRIARNRNPCVEPSWEQRLKLVQWQSQPQESIKAEEVWFLAGKDLSPELARTEASTNLLRRSLHLVATCGAQVLNYVGSIYDGPRGGPAPNSLPPDQLCGPRSGHSHNGIRSIPLSPEECEVAGFCTRQGIRNRFFLASWLVGESYLAHSSGGEIDRVLRALDAVIAEIQERSSEYFDFQALKIFAPENSTVNLVRMDHAVRRMLQIATQEKVSDSLHCFVSPEETSWQDFCELLSDTYSVSVLPCASQQDLNAIDTLLAHQFSGAETAWTGEQVGRYQDQSMPVDLQIDRPTQVKFLTSIRHQQERARRARDQRIAALPEKMQKRTIARNGSDLTYYTAGTDGEYILVLNALGQPLDYWPRLIDVLMRRYRIVLWETRGLSSASEELRVSDQVDDVDAILRQEQVDSCHLVGWCTGPQVAVEFYLRHPHSVLDMVFLSCAFKVAGRPELETIYGKNLEGLCKTMIQNPKTTGSIRRSLSVPPTSDVNLSDSNSKNLAGQVLALTNAHLRNSVLAPFQTETSTFNYARQILDLLTYHTLEHAAKVQTRVLILGCERDQVAAAAKSGVVAGLFPTSCHVELPGATHYAFYDRPELVGRMIELFFHESKNAASRETVVGAMAD